MADLYVNKNNTLASAVLDLLTYQTTATYNSCDIDTQYILRYNARRDDTEPVVVYKITQVFVLQFAAHIVCFSIISYIIKNGKTRRSGNGRV